MKVVIISAATWEKMKLFLTQWNNLTVIGGELKKSNTNAVLKIPESGTESGVPDGYEATAVTLCVDGAPVTGTILFKEDEA